MEEAEKSLILAAAATTDAAPHGIVSVSAISAYLSLSSSDSFQRTKTIL